MLHTLREFVRRQPALVVAAALLAAGGFAFFINIIEDVVTGDSGPVDKLLLVRASRLSRFPDGNWLTPLAHGVSLLGNWQTLIPLGAALFVRAWARRGHWRAFLFYALSCAGCAALVLGFKYLIARPRPRIVPALEQAPFLSFPSGHVAFALVGWGFAAYLIARRDRTPVWLRALLVLLVLLVAGSVGASRIYLAAHYPSDVAGGLLIGVPWLVGVLLAFERGAVRRRGQVLAIPER